MLNTGNLKNHYRQIPGNLLHNNEQKTDILNIINVSDLIKADIKDVKGKA
ncbi:MAG: hypothetical protein GY795_35770 [Desulfobacterales bacterium]|nr:hypothetical protein [Desulfobacterales bacterium]